MIRINLLPHREIKRKRQQKEFISMMVSVAILAGVIWFAVHSWLGSRLEGQNSRNKYLEDEIAKLDKQIEEIQHLKEQTSALLQRKKVVESLQANRNQAVELLDQLVRQLPDGVYLKSVQQKGVKVTINGYAQSNARVSTFMRNLDGSPYLEQPNLVEISAVQSKNISEFTLTVLVKRPAEETDTGKKPAGAPAKASKTALLSADKNTPSL